MEMVVGGDGRAGRLIGERQGRDAHATLLLGVAQIHLEIDGS